MESLTVEGALKSSRVFNQKIFRAAGLVGFLYLVVYLGSVFREVFVAKYFGRGDNLDAYLIAFLLPSFVTNLVANSFGAAVVPTFIQTWGSEGRDAAQQLFSGVMVWSVGLLVGVSVLLAGLAPYYLPLLASGFAPAKLLLARRLLYLLLPFVTLSGLAAIWSGVLNAREQFALPALAPVLSPTCVLIFLVLRGEAWGIFALVLGTVTGVAVQAVILGWRLKAQGLRLRPRWYGLDSRVREVAGQYLPMLAGAFLMGSTELVDQSMAAMLEPGSVAALNYGKKLVSVVLGVSSMGLGTAALPYFSQMVARQDWAGCRHTLRTYSRLIVLVMVPTTLALILFSRPLVRILFERGAFTGTDTRIVSGVQTYLFLQIPFYTLGIIGVRLISALKRNSLLLAISAVNTVLNATLNLIFMRFAGVAGIALSTSVVYMVSCVLIYRSTYSALARIAPQDSFDGSRSL